MNRTREAQNENAPAPAAPAASADDAEPKEPVKKEHDPVEIIGEPFLVYDHFVKGNSDLVNKNAGEADETADRPVTAVVAGQDGYVAASAGKDSTIQLWYTYDFYAEILAEMYGYSYDYDYDPTIGTGQASPNQPNAQEGNARAGNTKTGQAAGRQQNAAQGNNTDRAPRLRLQWSRRTFWRPCQVSLGQFWSSFNLWACPGHHRGREVGVCSYLPVWSPLGQACDSRPSNQ